MTMENFFAGHNHVFPGRLTPGCPACDQLAEARNRAIEHLSEALYLLSGLRGEDDRATVRLNLAPTQISGDDVARCHSIDLSAKQAEALSDAIDSMNAYASSKPPAPDLGSTTVDPALVDELEKHCLGMDADFLMDLAAQNPNSAVAAFDEIFKYADYDQIMREDGDL